MKFGMLYDIEKQLNETGLTLGENRDTVEKLHKGLVMNKIYGTLIDSSYKVAINKLNKLIAEWSYPINA